MTLTSKRTRSQTIDEHLHAWLHYLRLQNWRVSWKDSEKLTNADHLMEIRITRSRKIATISISPKCASMEERELEKLLIHELLHIVYDPIIEEQGFQQNFLNLAEEYTIRTRAQLEKVIEETAMILFNLYHQPY